VRVLTSDDAFEGQSVKTTRLTQKCLFLVLAVTILAVLMFRHDGIMLAMGTIVVPVSYVVARRQMEKARHRETEDRLLMQTRAYLQNAEPARGVSATPAIDGRKLPTQGFRKFEVIAFRLPFADPRVFGLLPGRYAIRSLLERSFAGLAKCLPEPASLPLSELVMAAGAQGLVAASAPGRGRQRVRAARAGERRP
jgi:hypothetical protein